MPSSSLENVSPAEAQSQVSALPVDTFTEQLTHEPQRKAKLYSLPLIRTAVALVTVLWVIGVYAGNPDGFWQAQIDTFMVAIAGLAVALAIAGWLAVFLCGGVAPPKRDGHVYCGSFMVPLTVVRESSGEWFNVIDGHLVASLAGEGPRGKVLDSGTAVIPLDLLEVSYDLLEGNSPRMNIHLSDIKYDTRYATWTLHLPASYSKRWKPIFADAKASERVTTGREPKFDSKVVRTYTWESNYDWDVAYIAILILTFIGYALVTSFIMSGVATTSQGVSGATLWGVVGILFAPVVVVVAGILTYAEYIKYAGEVGDLNPFRYYCHEAVPMLTDSEKSVISLSGGWVFPLVKFKNGGRYGGWVSESKGARQVVLLAPSGRRYVLDLPRDTTIHYSSDPKYSCAIVTLKIGDEVVGAKLTLPKDAEPMV